MIISMSLCARALSNGTITNDPEARVTLKVILAIFEDIFIYPTFIFIYPTSCKNSMCLLKVLCSCLLYDAEHVLFAIAKFLVY